MIIEIIISHIDFYVIERLRELRVRSTPYIDQVELAQRIGVSEGYLGQIENPKSRAKYNMRMLSRAAKALGLKSYQDILPTEVLKDDMVKIRLKLLKSDTKKHEVDETGNVKKRFDIISIKPLNDDELMKWNNKDLEYLTIIEK
ncbi:helix-turn-helix domain-containing protein [Arenibacter algicola]|jgi:transcriptional regulator with XRE-family HTH domain|uniref:Transcriptional regulator n=1 Tax=Arenibacter algicola TaxID=616991 RepID=A0A221V021_9FLAO|nr:helix-turn-helix transcriptional regulator [Arenibacter algicola]ASO06860.1 transcriptional regulator [Arenibacter algicola]